MRFSLFKKRMKSLVRDKSICTIAIPTLSICLLIAMGGWMTKDVVVTVAPPEFHKAYTISRDAASSAYKEAWGQALAIIVGNASPKQANYKMDQIRLMMTTSAYQKVSVSLFEHFRNLEKNGLVTSFSPSETSILSDGRVYVTGTLSLYGSSPKPERLTYTFMSKVLMENYLPSIKDFDFFEGRPKLK